MRTIATNIYTFDELSDKVKQKAKDDHETDNGYISSDESLNSIKKLAEHFGGAVINCQVDYFNTVPSFMTFFMPDDMEEDEIGRRLLELGSFDEHTGKGHGECKLTGYCTDEDAIDGFRAAFHQGERDLNKLMEVAFDSWLEACQEDCKSFYEDEQFSEHCEVNGYEFYEDGRFYIGED